MVSFLYFLYNRRTNFSKARKRHPYLKKFENNWATDAICHQYFKNHRRHLLKRVKSVGLDSVVDPSMEDGIIAGNAVISIIDSF